MVAQIKRMRLINLFMRSSHFLRFKNRLHQNSTKFQKPYPVLIFNVYLRHMHQNLAWYPGKKLCNFKLLNYQIYVGLYEKSHILGRRFIKTAGIIMNYTPLCQVWYAWFSGSWNGYPSQVKLLKFENVVNSKWFFNYFHMMRESLAQNFDKNYLQKASS